MTKKNWTGRSLTVSMDMDGNLLQKLFHCPLCGKAHKLDDPEELAKESLYCDTEGVRIDYPKGVSKRINQYSKPIKISDLSEEEKVKLDIDSSKNRIKIEFKF